MMLAENNGCNNIKVRAALQLQSCAQCLPQHSQWQLYHNHPNPQKVVLNSGCTTTTRSYLLHAPCIASAIYPIMLCLSLCTHWSQHSINQHSPFPLTWHQLCNKWGHGWLCIQRTQLHTRIIQPPLSYSRGPRY